MVQRSKEIIPTLQDSAKKVPMFKRGVVALVLVVLIGSGLGLAVMKYRRRDTS